MTYQAVKIVLEYYRRMNTNDYGYAAELFSDDYILEWPQSRERIRGKANFITVNKDYPTKGRWRFAVRRIVGNDTEAASDVTVEDDAKRTRALTFTTIEDGKITKQTEYWADDYDAPDNRRHLTERIWADQ